MSVTAPLQATTSANADGRYSRYTPGHPDLGCYGAAADTGEQPGWPGLDQEDDGWPAGTITTTPTAPTRTAPAFRAKCSKRVRRRATGPGSWTESRSGSLRGSLRASPALLPPLASHLPAWLLAVAVLVLAAGYVLLTLARPTRRCPRCEGQRISRTRWRKRIVPCRRCSGTGRAPRMLGPLIHRTYWLIRSERTRRP